MHHNNARRDINKHIISADLLVTRRKNMYYRGSARGNFLSNKPTTKL